MRSGAESIATNMHEGHADSAFDSLLRRVACAKTGPAYALLPAVGQVVNAKYRIDECLGCGGMGAVFRATHLISQKPVALKWMLRSRADEHSHQRLLREAAAAGRIEHPNVVDVYDVGEDGDCAYLVMELLRGQSLRARLLGGPIEFLEAVAMLLPAMRGVRAAHRAGVIHRDLKPDNIFLCTGPDGEAREAKVLDFGISAIHSDHSAALTLTETGAVLGTPAYMSPEQLTGGAADERTDVYALGVILYEMLTGVRPFDARTYPALLLAIAHEAPRRPRELCSAVPPELEQILLCALAKQPDARFQDVETFMAALSPFSSSWERGTSVRPVAVRKRTAYATHALIALSLVSLAYALFTTPSALPDSSPQEVAFRKLREGTSIASRHGLVQSSTRDDSRTRAPAAVAVNAVSAAVRAGTSSLPQSCRQAQQQGRRRDGLVKIDPDGPGPQREFEVYCFAMSDMSQATGAREYLSLAHGAMSGESERNMTRFTYDQAVCPCPDLIRRFERVRLHAPTLEVDPRDGTFASYDRSLSCELDHRNQCGESINLAWGGAGSCRGSGDRSGQSSIDLRDTSFALAPGAVFVPAGFGAAGDASISADDKTVTLNGGGLCGSLVPTAGTVPLVARR